MALLVPRNDLRLRNSLVAASILPDIDALPYVLGEDAFERWHHSFGHNVWLGLAAAAGVAWLHRRGGAGRAGLAALLAAALFASHLLTDAYFTGWALRPLWPLAGPELLFHTGYMLWSPINWWLIYGLTAIAGLLAPWRQVTPLDFFSPALDRLVVDSFRRRTLRCATCAGPASQRCHGCQSPTCLRHGRVRWGFRLDCGRCS